MSDIHIEEFYHDIGLILSRLYACFPRQSTIYVADISGPDTPDEFGLHSERHNACLSAMIWLASQDYIRFDSIVREEAIEHACLTEKSFLTLSNQASIDLPEPLALENLPPYILKKSISHIALLRRALKSQSIVNISDIVLHIMEQSRQFK